MEYNIKIFELAILEDSLIDMDKLSIDEKISILSNDNARKFTVKYIESSDGLRLVKVI